MNSKQTKTNLTQLPKQPKPNLMLDWLDEFLGEMFKWSSVISLVLVGLFVVFVDVNFKFLADFIISVKYIQFPNMNTDRSLNKPYVNDVTLWEQNWY